ncbi:zinc knuckle [Ancylostoma caninum]|uniref:Zinc knuckle n=1 Tax=Ancylostoma caninum TaxID=29170 RepID=A0A368GEG5_ANCCA|nr:zinc knuckle [Ancylostoma caninum]
MSETDRAMEQRTPEASTAGIRREQSVVSEVDKLPEGCVPGDSHTAMLTDDVYTVDSDADADDGGDQGNKKVDYVSGSQLCAELSKNVKERRVEIMAEVAKYMRTNDKRLIAIDNVVENTLRFLLEKLRGAQQMLRDVEERAAWMQLIEECLDSRSRNQVLDKLIALESSRAELEGLSSRFGWEQSELITKIEELEKTMQRQEELISMLQEKLSCVKDAEVEKLKRQLIEKEEELEKLRQSRRPPVDEVEVDGPTVPGEKTILLNGRKGLEGLMYLRQKTRRDDRSLQTGGNEHVRRLESSVPRFRLLTPATTQRAGTSYSDCESEAGSYAERSRPGTGRRNHPGDGEDTYLGRYFKCASLPDVPVYSGKDEEYSVSQFYDAFQLKYPRRNWEDRELCALFKAKLKGKARAQFESIPQHKREDFGTMVEEMRKLANADMRNREVVAIGELQRLRKAESQTVAEFCVDLERLTSKAYPELTGVALASVRAQKLYEQLANWSESYHLQEAMEKDKESAYDSLEEAAMRVERRRITMQNARQRRFPTEVEKSRERHRERKEDFDSERSGARRTQEKSEAERMPRSRRLSRKDPGEVKCCNCGSAGHFARDCKQQRRNSGNGGIEQKAVTSLSTRVRNVECRTIEMGSKLGEELDEDIYGGRITVQVRILGNEWTALLDTGSEISILPVRILRQALDRGVDIDEEVQELEMERRRWCWMRPVTR